MDAVKKCSKCDRFYHPADYAEGSEARRMIDKENVCFDCAWWIKRAGMQDNPKSVITDTEAYWIGDENLSISDRGFSGDLFTIKFTNGEIVKTTNLSSNGEIPEYLKDMFTVNAKFIEE